MARKFDLPTEISVTEILGRQRPEALRFSHPSGPCVSWKGILCPYFCELKVKFDIHFLSSVLCVHNNIL